MRVNEVPQETNAALAGIRKAVYACDENGVVVTVPSLGWEVEEIVTQHAVDAIKQLASVTLANAKAGMCSPLAYWMYEKRMDEVVLAQSTGIWRWRVRRHLQSRHFAKLPDRILHIYAEALGLPIDTLKSLP
jgi:hypothetical protein